MSFFNAQNNANPPTSLATTTTLQAPDDGDSYFIANQIFINDSTTFQVGSTNANTSLTLAPSRNGFLNGDYDPASVFYNGAGDNLTKTGPGTLKITTPSTIGSTTIDTGTVILDGIATAPLDAFTLNGGTTLAVDNSAQNMLDRLSQTSALTFNGGTFNYIGAPGALSSEELGPIQLNAGAATIASTTGAGNGTVELSSVGLTRSSGSTINFVGINSPLTAVPAGAEAVNQFVFLTPPAATATNNAGTISSVAVTSSGAGYTSPPQVTLEGGGGTYTSATAAVDAATGVVTGVTVTGANGYTSVPTVTIAPPASTAIATATLTNDVISSINILDGGTGYSAANPPTVTLTGGNFTTLATATAVVNSGGVITQIQINNPGTGTRQAQPSSSLRRYPRPGPRR